MKFYENSVKNKSIKHISEIFKKLLFKTSYISRLLTMCIT